ncbi:MAG: S9 family peptidase [Candidatus Heimdallarchaeota archaeon]|nr:S9 family peptidase [Candidatus Heimdallarchaeota archaeon]
MRKKLELEKMVKFPYFIQHAYFNRHDDLWFFSDIEGPDKAFEVNLEDFSYKPFHENLSLGYLNPFLWLEKNKKLLINRDNEGNEQFNIHLYDFEKNKEIKLTDTPNNKGLLADISPDNKYILIRSNRNKTDNLFKLNIETKELTQLTFHDSPSLGGVWTSQNIIYYSAIATENRRNIDIWMVHSDGSNNKQLLHLSNDSLDYIYGKSKDGELLLICTNARGADQTLIYNTKTNQLSWFGGDQLQERGMQISKDKSKLLVIRDEAVRSYPVIYNIETKEEFIPKIPGVIRRAQFAGKDRYLFYSRSDPQIPNVLALYDLTKNVEIPIVIPDSEYVKEDFYEPEFIHYTTFDNRKIGAVVYKPDIERGKKYPALVLAPGGPGGRLQWDFYDFAQAAVNQGFVLISPHIRGSFGYGKEFRDLINFDIGGGDAKDYIYSKKYLESLEYVDMNRIGIFGGSYGGYMTYLQLTKYADAGWNAGAAYVGITSWKTMYDAGMPAYKNWIEGLFGTYEENKELWEDRSPLNFVEHIQAPILMIQAVNDPRCTIGESRQFRDKLIQLDKKEGVDFEYFEIGKEGHMTVGQEARLRTDKMILEFFMKYL